MKKIFNLLHLGLVVALCLLCGNISAQKQVAKIDAKEVLKFSHFSFIDRQGTGIEAFNFLLPVGWQFEGGINWILDNPSMPANSAFRVYNTKGKEEFEVFANRCFFWTTNLQLLAMFPPGAKYFGSTVKLPVNAHNALKKIILPQERQNYPDFKIASQTDLPELVEALGAGKQAQSIGSSKATGAKARINYRKNGIEMEEEFYAVVENITFPIQTMRGPVFNTIWYVDYIFSFKAEKGKLENQTKIFQTITSSFKLNPKWYAKYTNVIE